MNSSHCSEGLPLLGLNLPGGGGWEKGGGDGGATTTTTTTTPSSSSSSSPTSRKRGGRMRTIIASLTVLAACIVVAASLYYHHHSSGGGGGGGGGGHILIIADDESGEPSQHHHRSSSSTPRYTKVQTLSFGIYTGGAPAFKPDEDTDEATDEPNDECSGLHSFGKPEGEDGLQCYLGLEDAAYDIERRMSIMIDAVDAAYDRSDDDPDVLKIFLAPEFFFRWKDGAYKFQPDGAKGDCDDVCHILKGLENIVAHPKYENWLFLFGTIVASEDLPAEDPFDYQFFNFAPLYKGYDPSTSSGVGKKFVVPKRYVSQIDFLTPLRDLRNASIAVELLDRYDRVDMGNVVINPHESGVRRYGNDAWLEYKAGLSSSRGYTMIEYGWFYVDGISFAVEICVDHLVHRALSTYMADLVTGSKTLVPSSSDGVVSYVGIPKEQAQIQLVSSGGMGVNVESVAVADGGHVFLQDGIFGDLPPRKSFGQNPCNRNQYEFEGGSECVRRTAIVSASDVTFEYEMNMEFEEYNLYSMENWKGMIKGVFSRYGLYHPKLTIYDPVNITMTT